MTFCFLDDEPTLWKYSCVEFGDNDNNSNNDYSDNNDNDVKKKRKDKDTKKKKKTVGKEKTRKGSIKNDEIMSACITMRPNLYVNESLTPKRLSIFKTIWNIRKMHREQFQQCYTRDGKIYVKLKCSNLKHVITSDESLRTFLDKFLALRDNA